MACFVGQFDEAEFSEGVFDEEHEMFRQTVRRFIRTEIEPNYLDWEREGRCTPKELWLKAGQLGLLGTNIPEEYGGPGCDPLYSIIHAEELARSVAGASTGGMFDKDMLTEILVSFGSEAQKHEWFPRILSGEVAQAFGLTEPDAGSDIFNMRTRAKRDGDDFLISGQKVYISGGYSADLIYLFCKTDRDVEQGRGAISLFIVDPNSPGFERRRMNPMGMASTSLGELFLDEVRVPASNLIGEEGAALTTILRPLLPVDRMLSAVTSLGIAELAFQLTLDYVKQRQVFGKRVFDFQNTQFKLAEMKATLITGRALRETSLRRMSRGTLDDTMGSTAKYWLAEQAFNITNECMQLHGGIGYMNESAISRLFTYARLGPIYAGTAEIQKRTIAMAL